MKIIELRSENFKRLTVVQVTPEGNLIEITGANGSGKSSLLDSIWAALDYASAMENQPQPIREGEKSARIELKLGDGKDTKLIVERRFTEKASYLSVRTPDGADYRSPQTMLEGLLGALTFDPLEFKRLKPVHQLETLRGMVKVDIDIPATDRAVEKAFNERTEVNRQAKAARARAEAIVIPPDLPDTRPDTTSILGELAEVDSHNARIRASQREREALRSTIADTEARIFRLREELSSAEEFLIQEKRRLEEAKPIPALIDPAAIRARFDDASRAAQAWDRRDNRKKIEAEAEGLENQAWALTTMIDDLKQKKTDAIARAKMPVDGLGFGDGHVTFEGLPFAQASDAEQLRVSTAIAAATNSKLRVIRIRDGSLLDKKSMRWLASFADKSDMQIWIERVGEGGTGVIMEDGHVRGQILEPTPERKKKGTDHAEA